MGTAPQPAPTGAAKRPHVRSVPDAPKDDDERPTVKVRKLNAAQVDAEGFLETGGSKSEPPYPVSVGQIIERTQFAGLLDRGISNLQVKEGSNGKLKIIGITEQSREDIAWLGHDEQIESD